MKRLALPLLCLLLASLVPPIARSASDTSAADAPADGAESPEARAFMDKVRALKWVTGPTTVAVDGNSELRVPEGYRYLDKAETDKFLELNRNLSSGTEVMIAPDSLAWSAYLNFADEGYVKDNEQLDADAILKSLQSSSEQSNAERRRRGWPDMHVLRWAVAPNYSSRTQRLEWATLIESEGQQSVNFLTKILGRRGHTTVVLAAAPADLPQAQAALDGVLGGYQFKSGDTYAEFRPGDKVAAYGLAALVLGGAAAIATKKGFWAVAASALAAGWKFIAVGLVAVGAWLRRLFGGKSRE